MKFWVKILFVVLAVLAVLFSGVYVFLGFQGKALIVDKLQELTQKKVSIGYFGISLPLNLEIRNLNVQDLAKVDSIFVSPSIIALMRGKIALNNLKVINPELTFQRFAEQAGSAPAGAAVSAKTAPSKKQKFFPLIFKRLNIKNGRINFIDHTIGQQPLKITVKDLYFNLTNFYTVPQAAVTNFELKGRIPWQEGTEEARIEAEGWLNFAKKNMEATLKIEDIDGIYLYPYYSNWVDLEKARIEKAKLNFTSNIQGLNNNVTAECHLELTDIVRKPRPPEEAEQKAAKITNAVLDIFKALNQGKIILDFTIRTKMDRPEFGFGNIKMAFENKLSQARSSGGFKTEDIVMFPGRLLEGMVKGATDLSKAVVDGTFAVGNEVKKAVEDSFKKEKKE
jgi:hypothetical protein